MEQLMPNAGASPPMGIMVRKVWSIHLPFLHKTQTGTVI